MRQRHKQLLWLLVSVVSLVLMVHGAHQAIPPKVEPPEDAYTGATEHLETVSPSSVHLHPE